jgi:uncharacterized protein
MARVTLVLLALAAACLGQTAGRILYITHSAGFRHDSIVVSRQTLHTLSSRLTFTMTEDLSAVSAENLRNYDAVLFFTSGELALSAAQRTALLDFVRRGGGFGGVHSATDTLYTWPEYGDLIGGYFAGHPWVQPVRIDIEDPAHPAVSHLGTSFTILDEIYQFRDFDRQRVRVLMTLDTTSVNMRAEGVNPGTEDFPLAWVRPYGSGRVFYTALGHFDETWRDARFLKMMEGALLWLTRQADAAADPRVGPAPVAAGLGNAATVSPADRIAPRSLISIFGANLTTGSTMAAAYPNRLAGTVVRLGDRRLPLVYASPAQVNAAVPADMPPGAMTLSVETPGSTTATRPVEVVASAAGVFAVVPVPGALTVWATGLGTATPEARLSGAPARILFSGDAPGFPGLDQINIEASGSGVARLQVVVGGTTIYDSDVQLAR